MLGKKSVSSVLPRYESSAIDDSPDLACALDERVLKRRRFLIQPNLVFFDALSADKAPFIGCLFGAAIDIETDDAPALDSVAANLIQDWSRTVDKYCRLGDLLSSDGLLLIRG